jgi:hypothetical protein
MSGPDPKPPSTPIPASWAAGSKYAHELARGVVNARNDNPADPAGWWAGFLCSISGLAIPDIGAATVAVILENSGRSALTFERNVDAARPMAKTPEGKV